MRVSASQLEEIEGAIEALFNYVRRLREDGVETPSDDRLERLFTDLEEYGELDTDENVQRSIHLLYGLAIGLGLETSLDLYIAYDEGRLAVGPDPSRPLAEAADHALGYLGGLNERGAREVVQELGPALAAWRGKLWR